MGSGNIHTTLIKIFVYSNGQVLCLYRSLGIVPTAAIQVLCMKSYPIRSIVGVLCPLKVGDVWAASASRAVRCAYHVPLQRHNVYCAQLAACFNPRRRTANGVVGC